jgi:tRNA (cytidine56-2'-O)-methyltransferase
VARAFGADAISIDTADRSVERNLASVNRRFGGSFNVATGVDWRRRMREFSGTKVHLTMYGMTLEDAVLRIPKAAPLLIVVGASKVPASAYRLADFNVSVGNQPHSEVAAIALFLDRWFQGKQLRREFGGPMRIIPSQRGKNVLDAREEE